MAAFVKYGLTTAGRNMIAKGAAGKTISYTRIAVGDGQLSQAQDPSTMTALVNEVLSIDITSVEMIGDGQVRVRGAFSNAQLQTGFLYREIGLFATDPDTGLEVLYCYGNAVDQAEWIPPAGTSTTIERIINVVTTVGPATNVTATLKSGIYITTEDFGAAMALKADQAWTEAQLSNKANIEWFDASGKAKSALNSEKLGGTSATGYQLKDTALQWYDLELMNEFNPSTSQTPQYMRDNGGWVQVLCSFNRSTPPDSFEQLAVLPQGYRPPKQIHVPVIAGIGTWSSYVTINPSGSINFYNGSISSGWPNGALGFNVVFKTVV